MNKVPFVPPKLGESGFNCPHCKIYARQDWWHLSCRTGLTSFTDFPDAKGASCHHCGRFSLWLNDKMLFPDFHRAELPNPDMGGDVLRDYQEAAQIAHKSPRGAAALLRLAVQKLCKQSGESGNDLNGDIANLVKKGLSPHIQKALDTVRVIGNQAVHPGQIDLRDDTKTVAQLFKLVNFIAERMITEPREINENFNDLPEDKRKQIEKRDSQ